MNDIWKNLYKFFIVTLSVRNLVLSDMYSLKLFFLNSRVIRNEYFEVFKIFYVLILEGGLYRYICIYKIL